MPNSYFLRTLPVDEDGGCDVTCTFHDAREKLSEPWRVGTLALLKGLGRMKDGLRDAAEREALWEERQEDLRRRCAEARDAPVQSRAV
jgi:hypothetical protein